MLLKSGKQFLNKHVFYETVYTANFRIVVNGRAFYYNGCSYGHGHFY